jgi:hypothetical protein
MLLGCLILSLLALPLGAGDFAGQWSGSVEVKSPEGEIQNHPVYFELKQDGQEVTGSAGENEADLHPITNGKADGDRLTFEVHVENDDGKQVFKVSATAAGKDKLEGTVERQRGGEVISGKLTLSRKV